MTDWTDLSGEFGTGTVLTSSDMQSLRDNNAAIAEKDSSVPFLGNGWSRTLLQSFSITSLSDIEIENIPTSYDQFEIYINNLILENGSYDLMELRAAVGSGGYTEMDRQIVAFSSTNTAFFVDISSSGGGDTCGSIGHTPLSQDGEFALGNYFLNISNPFGDYNFPLSISGRYNAFTNSGELYTGIFNNVVARAENQVNMRAIKITGNSVLSNKRFISGEVQLYGVFTNSW